MPRPPSSVPSASARLAPSAPDLFAGTSGWAYRTWKPGFYPQNVPQKAFLPYYAGQLTAVEVNYTFRTLPTKAQLEGWIAATPPGFRFSFKAPQRITHFARLRECEEPVAQFLAALEPARSAGRLGPVLFQLPPNFRAEVDRLREFLAMPVFEAEPRQQVAFEFRHESWFTDDTYAILRSAGAALCVADTDDLATPDVATANFRCYRLRRDGGYTADEIRAFAERFSKLARKSPVYVFFRHQDEPTGALQAVEMLARTAEASGGRKTAQRRAADGGKTPSEGDQPR